MVVGRWQASVQRGVIPIGVNLSFATGLISARCAPVGLVLAGCQRQTSRGFGSCQALGFRVWGFGLGAMGGRGDGLGAAMGWGLR